MSSGNKGFAGNVFNAWATATIANAVLTNGGGMGALLTRSNVGIYVFTLTASLAMVANRYSLVVGPFDAASSPAYRVTDTSNVAKTITFIDNAGGAIELTSLTVGAIFLPI